MYCYRVTKYNPIFRDSTGAYKKNDWMSYSDIGTIFGNTELSSSEYLKTENAYVETISQMMTFLRINSLVVTALERNFLPKKSDLLYSSGLMKAYKTVKKNQIIKKEMVLMMVRLALRSYIWCKLESDKFFVHFGHDYYMYIGSNEEIDSSLLERIEKKGLFVESMDRSPYAQTAYDEDI